MKKALIILSILSLYQASAFAYDCDSQPYATKTLVGELAPSKARPILATGNFSSVEGQQLLKITSNQADLKKALNLGLQIQKLGNESLIFDVDALVYLARGSNADPTSDSGIAYQLMQKALGPQTSTNGYYNQFQLMHGARILATLRILSRNDEANQLQQYLGGKYDAGKLNSLALLMSNTGNFDSKSNSIKFCKMIQGF